MATTDFAVRSAQPEDAPAVNAILRHYILNTVITFSIEPNSDDDIRARYDQVKSEGLPFLVAEHSSSGEILGYAYVFGYRGARAGYRHTLELSLFCHPEHVRKGVGRELLNTILSILREPGKWPSHFQGTRLIDHPPRQVIAVMSIDIEGPGDGLKLRDWYLGFGFEVKGRLDNVGWKRDRWIDTLYLQLSL